MVGLCAGDCTHRECQAIGRTGEGALPSILHSGTPGNRATDGPRFPDNLTHLDFGKPVLHRDKHPVFSKIVFQEIDDPGIELLLGHQEYDVIQPAHILRSEGCDLLGKVDRAGNPCPMAPQSLDMSLVPVYQIDMLSILLHKGSKDSSQGPGSINCNPHPHIQNKSE